MRTAPSGPGDGGLGSTASTEDNVASTERPAGSAPGDAAERSSSTARAIELVAAADALVAEVLSPGRWPQARTVDRFFEGDRLERVLALYGHAIRLDPEEPAYPWNLAALLRRLGLNELALGYLQRAIRVAREVGDKEWSDASAYLALAEAAAASRHDDVAVVALARAKSMQPSDPAIDRQVARLLRSLKRSRNGDDPVRTLTAELARLSA